MTKKLQLMGLIFLMGFALLETILRLNPPPVSERSWFNTDVTEEFRNTPWYKEWFREHDQLRRDFQAYELYHTTPYEGKYLSISKEGYRATQNPSFTTGTVPTRIGLLGGSQMWGSGARNEFTAASRLSHLFYEKSPGMPIELVNYSEIGFNLTQSFHRAVRILTSTATLDYPTPKVMVFFSVNNDVVAGLNNFNRGFDHPAGLPWEYDRYQYLFQMGHTGEIGLSDILLKFEVFRSAKRALERVGLVPPTVTTKNFWRDPTESQWRAVGDEIAQHYLRQVEVAHHTCKSNGILPIFVIPPILFHKERASSEERTLLEKNAKLAPYVNYTYEKIEKLSEALPKEIQLYNWSRLPSDHPETLFIDIFHYNELGHLWVAKKLFEMLEPQLNDLSKTRALGR